MFRSALRAMRPQQWAKNLLVLAVVVISHRYRYLADVWRAGLAGVLFCAASSSVYLANDVLDIEADREHPIKKRRAIACGDLPVPSATGMAILLGLAALAGAWLLSPVLALVFAVYIAASHIYSVWIKKLLIVDVVVLACLYVIRVVAGGVAIGIWLSFWTAAFSLFFFFSLALVKRYSELRNLRPERRAYLAADLPQLNMLGVASSLVSVLIVGLYIESPDVRQLYRHPAILSFLCPILLAWCARLWVLAARGEIDEDPIAFAVRDRTSYAVVLLMGLTLLAAS